MEKCHCGFVYSFAPGDSEGDPDRKDLLGGKGASLAAMSRANLPVPPGFTISAECCQPFLASAGRWPPGLQDQVRQALARLEQAAGRTFGDIHRPLLVSVRSGAAVSMPGMMDTILNCGLDVRRAGQAEDAEGFWRVYSQFVFMFARAAGGIDPQVLEQAGRDWLGREGQARNLDEYRQVASAWQEVYHQRTGKPFPQEPWDLLVECINTVFRSWNGERAVAYRSRQNVTGLLGTAVTVQAMFPSQVSGIVFTANPNNLAGQELIIESSFGLGEAVVSGDVHPDNFLVDRRTLKIKSATVGHKNHVVFALGDRRRLDPDQPSLTAAQVEELAAMAMRVEQFFGLPLDIEWGWADGHFALLQARPVKGVQDAQAYEQVLAATQQQLAALLKAGRGPWVPHNLAETLPQPTPLTWSVMRRFMSAEGGFGNMYRLAGFEPSTKLGEDGFLTLLAGKIYMDVSRAGEMFFADYPYRYDVNLLRASPEASQAPPTLPAGSIRDRWRSARQAARVNLRLRGLARDFDRRLNEEIIPPFVTWCRHEKCVDLAALSGRQWCDLWDARCRRVMDDFAPLSLLPSMISAMALQDLRAFLAEHFYDLGEDFDELTSSISAPRHRDMTLRANVELFAISQGRLDVNQWLDRFAHRAAGEFDLAAPRWRERPGEVEAMAGRLRHGADPAELHQAHLDRTEAQVESLSARLPGGPLRRQLEDLLSLARRYLIFREDGKHYLMLGYDLLRDLALEAGRRLGIGEDAFFLTDQELKQAIERGTAVPAVCTTGVPPVAGSNDNSKTHGQDGRGAHGQDARATHGRDAHATPPGDALPIADIIAARKAERKAQARLNLPRVIDPAAAQTLGRADLPASADSYQALAISPGLAAGPAWIAHSPTQADQAQKGYVLVCPSTDPAWAPLFVNASALILESGGSLSHGAIVAREMGIPAVVLPGATTMLAQGEEITVDGRHGRVWRQAGQADADQPGRAAPDDVRIAPALQVPPRGRRERLLGGVRRYAILLWGLYLAAVFLLDGRVLYQPSMDALDAVLWPLVPALGKPGAVAAIAGAMALLTMLLQRVLCDNRRLREARRRSALLSKEAAALAAKAPRRQALQAAAAGVQARLIGAAMVPIALLLGPMVLVFVWLPARVDPASWNAPPGSSVSVVARAATGAGRVSLQVQPPLFLDETTPPRWDPPDIRQPLRRLLELQAQSPREASRGSSDGAASRGTGILPVRPTGVPPVAQQQGQDAPASHGRDAHATATTPTSAPATQPALVPALAVRLSPKDQDDLRAFLADGAVQANTWLVCCPPGTAGSFTVEALLGDLAKPAEKLTASIVLGDANPPSANELQAPPGAALRSIRLVYRGPAQKKVFWAPLAWAGLPHWELSWLWVYLLVYLPVMIAARWGLRVA